ncbi:hypothetical protein EYR40_011031 [Pleurotus pulmonarius]|nr:hypothetical protein EYR40_011031 [Pleurotus pulmonarius]
MEFCMDDCTVNAPLIPPITLAPASSAPTPVVPPQQGSSKMVTSPSPVSSPVSPACLTTKRPRRPSKLVTTPSPVLSPVSPPRPSIKCPRRGSKLNLNIIQFTPIHVKGSSMDEDNTSITLADELLDIELPNKKLKKKSKSTLSKAKNNAAIANGSLVKNTKCWSTYIQKLRALDEHVEVIMQLEAYNISQFKAHIKKRKAQGSKLHIVSISTMFHRLADSPSSAKPKLKPVKPFKRLCSGLTAAQDKQIPQYTSCTEVRYAGGKSRTTLATSKFGQTFSLLSKKEQAEVHLLYRNTCQWELDHNEARVFSHKCLNTPQSGNDTEELPQACSECLHLLTLHEFQVAIARVGTTNEKQKHIPGRYQSIVTGQLYTKNIGLGQLIKETARHKGDFLLDFTTVLSSGAFDDNPSFVQLLEVMLERHKRRDNSRGFQNMRYAADFDQFCHKIQCVHPEAYCLFTSKFGGRSEHSMLKICSTKPKMTVGISEATLKRVIKYLDDYNYPQDAPLARAVDDTKLHAALRLYYDQSKKTWFLLGSTGDPLIIANPELLPELIQQASSDIEKKLLQILLIDSTVPINIISLSSDGTVVERKAHCLLIESGFAAIEYTHIPHPNTGSPPLKIEILCIGSHCIAIIQDYIQDYKHFRKTCRNNIFTGAKQLVLGNELIYYEQVQSMVLNQDHFPLYDCNVLDQALCTAALISTQDRSVISKSVNNTLNKCGLAAAALNMRKLAALDHLVDEDPDTLAIIQAALKPILAAISALGASGQTIVDEIMKNATEKPRAVDVIVEEAEDPLSALSHISKYDLTVLVDERQLHQSKETTNACRPLSNRNGINPS